MRSLDERFWEKVKRGNKAQCWLWTGFTDGGYGRFKAAGGKVLGAHRVAYILTNGAPKENVLHKCDNRRCVNPSHLFEGTQAKNMQDMHFRGRSKHQKLTPEKVLRIRKALLRKTQKEVAEQFDMSRQAICAIANKTTWGWLR